MDTGVLERGPFLAAAEAALRAAPPLSLIAFQVGRAQEVRGGHGADVASRLVARLGEVLAETVRPGDRVGVLSDDCLGVLVQGDPASAREAAARLHRRLGESSRVPVYAGLASSAAADGRGAEALRSLAIDAAIKASRSEAHPGDEKAEAAHDEPLEERYQRLVLLNRMSLELFSEKPFREALAEASNIVLALTGARCVSVYFCDDFGQPQPVFRHGDPMFGGSDARDEETSILARAMADRRVASSSGRFGWLAAPLLSRSGAAEDGAFVLGYRSPQPPSPAGVREQTMLEIARLLRGARIVQRTLQRQKTMAEVSEQSADAILITDAESRVVAWNSSASDLFQWTKAEIQGRPADVLCPHGRETELAELENRARRSGTAQTFETVRQRKDGSLVPVDGTYRLLRDEGGSSYGMVRVYRDITRRKEVERMKTEFVSLVSHELRTPLTAIQGFAETILDCWDELDDVKMKEYLRIMLEESQRLGRLVTEFLDVSRLEAGASELRLEDASLMLLADRVKSLFKGHPSGATLERAFPAGADVVRADPDQVYRVLLNLCANALRYSPPSGAVTISSRRDGAMIEVTVADQGSGIPPEHRSRVFEKFSRLSDPVSRKSAGTGLGLAICKGIVEAHGGRIWVDAAPGGGAAFRFTLPAT